ncbi:hypothetical protein SAMN05444271_1663 [Halohasta litchfieldiae]|jgi:hypothetical protein|uniref:Uncharacterized protein n=1 Tax=Halohasta litchfieldiae TaxID=1073996 RepID=A0A1H6YM94_9EURY|nr:hypothetical protein [Halohasta litchfieldiae]SEJ38362.1 hypothetical protein SAMN05444271_1663 [Halohasta litchfieldiae]
MDARIVHGSIEIVQAFRDGRAYEGDRPQWMRIVIEEARTRLMDGSV